MFRHTHQETKDWLSSLGSREGGGGGERGQEINNLHSSCVYIVLMTVCYFSCYQPTQCHISDCQSGDCYRQVAWVKQ